MKFFIGLKNACLPTVFLWIVIILILAQCACGGAAQLPTVTAKAAQVTAKAPTVAPVRMDAPLHYVTTAPLHLRSCAGIDCTSLAYLLQGTEVEVEVMDIPGEGCAGASWYSVKVGSMAGFVCSLYVTEEK